MCEFRGIFLTTLFLTGLSYISSDCDTVFPNSPTFQNCQYRCHCKDDEQCDSVTGECDKSCVFGWMGPGCQYRNVATFNYVVYNIGMTHQLSDYAVNAVDGDVATCARSVGIPPNGFHYWRIQWNREYRIVGLVVKIKPFEVDDFDSFRVETGYGPDDSDFNDICYQHGAIPGTPVMEIMCNGTVWTKHLRIILSKPNTRIRVCEVEIYGGRVMSFNKPTHQSSTYSDSTSSLSVDGQAQTSGLIAEDTCSTTGGNESNPHWLVNFRGEYSVQSVNFYGRLHKYDSQYSGFRISLTDGGPHGRSIYQDTGSTCSSPDQCQPLVVELTSPVTARYLGVNRPIDNTILTICEVEAFAECPLHKCGWNCSNDCYCAHDTTGMYRVNGTCPYGCHGRWTGLENKCNIECNGTSWGNQCENTCGDCFDLEPCDAVTGYCVNGCSGSSEPPFCIREVKENTSDSIGREASIVGGCLGGVLAVILIAVFIHRYRIHKREQHIRENYATPDHWANQSDEIIYEKIDCDIPTK